MEDLHIVFDPYAKDGPRQFVVESLDAYNLAATGCAAYYPVGFYLKSPRGEVLGGLLGQIWGGMLHVSYLWIAEPARRGGHGTRLVREAEAYAIERGCRWASLETMSFQARPFYEKLGYAVFATIEDFPPGHAKYFLKKRLG